MGEQIDTRDTSNLRKYSILRDKKDRMWVGTFGGGLDLAESTEKGQTWAERYNIDRLHKSVPNYANTLLYPFIGVCFNIFCI